MIDRINRWIAVNMTLAMGSIWAFYGFVIFGLIPVIIPSVEPSLLYWSNFIQLADWNVSASSTRSSEDDRF